MTVTEITQFFEIRKNWPKSNLAASSWI